MKSSPHPAQRLIASSLLVSMLGLTTFGTQAIAQQAPAYPPSAAPAAPGAYTPPSADQLYQMVAPIALFPDNLVALVLAGATYPDQIAAANAMLTQNPGLTGQALVNATNPQPWDPSVKALTQFPSVLSQMSSSMDWTTQLGQAYYYDPTDVLNAVQVMRQRARAAGHLSSNRQMVVTETAPADAPGYTPDPNAPVFYEGPAIVPPPPQVIVIEPAQPDVVYVPYYDPAVVYGAPIAVYPGYVYARPAYAPGVAVTAGIFSFGVGIAVGAVVFSHVGWGWHSWGMHWRGPEHRGPGGPGHWHPSVVYNHTTYVSKSTTVVNHYNNRTINDRRGSAAPNSAQMRQQQMRSQQMREQQTRERQMHAPKPGATHPGAPATMPHFNANDARPGTRPAPRTQPNHGGQANHNNTMQTHHANPPAAHGAPSHSQAPRQTAPRPAQARPQAPHPQPHPQAQSRPHPQQAQPRPQPRPQAHPQAQPRPQPRPQAQPHPQPRPQAQPHPAPHPAPGHGEREHKE